jgi:hypothetical protein
VLILVDAIRRHESYQPVAQGRDGAGMRLHLDGGGDGRHVGNVRGRKRMPVSLTREWTESVGIARDVGSLPTDNRFEH